MNDVFDLERMMKLTNKDLLLSRVFRDLVEKALKMKVMCTKSFSMDMYLTIPLWKKNI